VAVRRVSAVASRLDSVIEAVPKEGYKAAVVLGIVERIRELADLAVKSQKLVECLGSSRGYCKEALCSPNCARIYMFKEGDTVRIGKVRGNASGIAITSSSIRLAAKGYSLSIGSNGIVSISIPAGITEQINLRDINDTFKKSYELKHVIRKVGAPLEVIVNDLQSCARASAIVCPI
jgi:hypothetical protein